MNDIQIPLELIAVAVSLSGLVVWAYRTFVSHRDFKSWLIEHGKRHDGMLAHNQQMLDVIKEAMKRR